jgi:hypothetical protein
MQAIKTDPFNSRLAEMVECGGVMYRLVLYSTIQYVLRCCCLVTMVLLRVVACCMVYVNLW